MSDENKEAAEIAEAVVQETTGATENALDNLRVHMNDEGDTVVEFVGEPPKPPPLPEGEPAAEPGAAPEEPPTGDPNDSFEQRYRDVQSWSTRVSSENAELRERIARLEGVAAAAEDSETDEQFMQSLLAEVPEHEELTAGTVVSLATKLADRKVERALNPAVARMESLEQSQTQMAEMYAIALQLGPDALPVLQDVATMQQNMISQGYKDPLAVPGGLQTLATHVVAWRKQQQEQAQGAQANAPGTPASETPQPGNSNSDPRPGAQPVDAFVQEQVQRQTEPRGVVLTPAGAQSTRPRGADTDRGIVEEALAEVAALA
jgi:hypothetical protein